MLTDRQKTLLMMQTNLGQIEAGIRQALNDPECIGEHRDMVDEMRAVTEAMQTTVKRALRSLHT